MNQAKFIQMAIIAVPVGVVLIGGASLFYFALAPSGETREGGREPENLRRPVSERVLRGWVEAISEKIGPRPASDETQLRIAGKWIQSELSVENMGYRKVKVQEFEADGAKYRNVGVELPGKGRRDEIVVIGAHYDSAPGCPAANDNGTGVAAVLAIANALIGTENARTVRFVFFANEEPPHFQTETMGSHVYAEACKERGEEVVAMLSLETMGYFSDEPGSQQLPPSLRETYPDTGNFIAFVSNADSRELLGEVGESFARHSDFPAESVAGPEELPGISWSDHWSFWQFGYPAVMVTDTAAYRYPHYHKPTDTPDKIDFPRFTEVVRGMVGVVEDLANP